MPLTSVSMRTGTPRMKGLELMDLGRNEYHPRLSAQMVPFCLTARP